MLAIAIQSLNPDYSYSGSCTDNTKESFDNLVDISGKKPKWTAVKKEMGVLKTKLNKTLIDKEAKERLITEDVDSIQSIKDFLNKKFPGDPLLGDILKETE